MSDTPELERQSVVDAARQAAIGYLGYAPRTSREVADKLTGKGFADDVVAETVAWLERLGYLDDAAFARAWAERRHAGRHASRSLLRTELRRKGVEDGLIGDALERIDEDSERTQAAALVARRLGSTRGLSTVVRTQRLLGMLARRGYSTAVALPVIREALAAEGVDDADDVVKDC